MDQLKKQARSFGRILGLSSGLPLSITVGLASPNVTSEQIPFLIVLSLLATIVCGLVYWQVSGVRPNGPIGKQLWTISPARKYAAIIIILVASLTAPFDGLLIAGLLQALNFAAGLTAYLGLKLFSVVMTFVIWRTVFRSTPDATIPAAH